MIIKELPITDIEQAKKLYCESFHKPIPQTTLKALGTILGVYLNEELIGIAQIDYINNIFENKRIAIINSFCIKEHYRHQGYGTLLLKECIKISKNNNCNAINLTSNKNRIYAHMLYEKNDFNPIDTILLNKNI